MAATEEILGDEIPSDAVMGTVRGAVQSNEPILGIVVTSEGDALVATEQRLLIATEDELVLDTGYEDITDLEVRTGWRSRGITLKTSEAEFECGIDDRDAATAMGNIIGDRAPGLDQDDTGEDGGGLMGRARGVFDTATGQDIRKFEEFVESATTVLVGLHRDQAATSGRLSELGDSVESIRQAQEEIDESLGRLDTAVAELREEIADSRSTVSSDGESGPSSMNRTILVISVVALILSVVSLVLRFV